MVTLDQVTIRGFTSIKEAGLTLGPVTTLIGANDTGKSNLLNAFALLSRLVRQDVAGALEPFGGLARCAFLGDYQQGVFLSVKGEVRWEAKTYPYLYEVKVRQAAGPATPDILKETLELRGFFDLRRKGDQLVQTTRDGQSLGKEISISIPRELADCTFLAAAASGRVNSGNSAVTALVRDPILALQAALADLQVYRLRPERLATPSIPEEAPRLQEDGLGLGSLVDHLATDPDLQPQFNQLRARLREIVPRVESVGVRTVQDQGVPKKKVHFLARFGDASFTFDASRASDGLMLLLAYLALSMGPGRSPLLILDEPENGVHVGRLKDVVELLRQSVAGTGRKLLLTTHSPYLLDGLQPEEVLIVSRDESGATLVTPMAQYPDIERWLRGFSLGEIWTNVGEPELTSRG